MDGHVLLEANAPFAESCTSSMRALDYPAMPALSLIGLDILARNARLDASFAQMLATTRVARQSRRAGDGIDPCVSNTTQSCRLAPATVSARGPPRWSTMRWCLLPSLPGRSG